MTKRDPFKYFHIGPEIIRLAVMLFVRFPLSLRNVEDLLQERGIDISHETVRFWWNRFGPIFPAEIRKRRVSGMRGYSNWQWHLDEVFVKINGERHYLWRAIDHEGEMLESFVTKTRDKTAALKFLKKSMKRYSLPNVLVTDKLRSYGAAMKVIGNADKQETDRWLNNRAENSHLPFRRRERAMQGFRSARSLQKFTAVHAAVCNHFNQERHLYSRENFKTNRAAALAESVRQPSSHPQGAAQTPLGMSPGTVVKRRQADECASPHFRMVVSTVIRTSMVARLAKNLP